MEDTTHEGNPTLRAVAEEVPVPITEEDQQLGEGMSTFLKDSQGSVRVGELQLRGGAGLVALQLNISKRTIAVHVPSNNPENETPSLSTVMYNLKILSHSAQNVRLGEGESCLSANRDIPGYVVRHNKIAVSYFDMAGEKHKARSKNYEMIAVQYEIDHVNGIMFCGHINKENPFASKEGVLVIE